MEDLQIQDQGVDSSAPQQSHLAHHQQASLKPDSLKSVGSEEPLPRFSGHRGSISTTTTDSTGSSPITGTLHRAASNFEDSPGTSPDNPAILGVPRLHESGSKQDLRFSPTAPPNKKPRNLKNLALNTSKTFPLGKALLTGTTPFEASGDAMASPTPLSTGFNRPTPKPRRNPSLSLSIQTPLVETFSSQIPFSQVPPTPSLTRPTNFRSFQSSPSLPTLLTSPDDTRERKVSTTGGFLPLPIQEDDRSYDVPESREQVPDAYPDGPICVYDPHIDLYLEPTAAEARKYDVIFNVASEVLNPFSTQSDAQVPSKSLHTAAEELRTDPTHSQTDKLGQPEYIHIPWEHNTDIVPDLHELVKVVDDRVQNGKRVLVHCQCGVSRSASLVVAYGIYKNPAITVQQAYDAVKQKSRWIGPNMNLIMQLQEFRSGLIKTSLNGNGNTKTSSRVLHSRQATENNSLDLGEPQIPQTAPLPELNNKHIPPQILTQHTEQISPGPSSAPSGTSWQSMLEQAPPVPRPQSFVSSGSSTPTTDAIPAAPSSMHYVEQLQKQTSQQSSPQRKLKSLIPIHLDLPATNPAHQALETPRSREFAMTSTKPSDLDETFGITSPRTDTFPTVLAADEPLMSPRSEEFAMAPVVPRELDDTVTLGLTSPRTESFFELPHRFSVPSPPRPSMQRPIALQPTSTHADAQAIAELRARMGFTNNRLTMDLQQTKEASTMPTATDTTTAAMNQFHDNAAAPEMDFADGLMSPRAVEFTANPIREALAAAIPETTVTDPRSPPVRGANPITQNIDDVL